MTLYLAVLPRSKIASSLCMKIMDFKCLSCIDSLIPKNIMAQTNKLLKKAHKFQYQKRQYSLKLIGMNKKMHPNLIKFIKEILNF